VSPKYAALGITEVTRGHFGHSSSISLLHAVKKTNKESVRQTLNLCPEKTEHKFLQRKSILIDKDLGHANI
jgi:hypothetical protein